MPGWPSWLSPRSLKPGILRSSSAGPNPGQDSNKVLQGRVSKPVSAKPKSSINPTKLEGHIANSKVKEESEDDSDNKGENVTNGYLLTQPTPSEQIHKSTKAEDTCTYEEEKVNGSHHDWDDEGKLDSWEASSTMANPIKRSPTDSASPKSPRSEAGFHSETDAESDADSGAESESENDSPWRQEQIFLNTILNARNEFTLMPSTWRMHFRGIPLPDSLFYIKTKTKSIRPRIYARTDKLEYRGAVALRKLIEVHARIQDIRSEEYAIHKDKSLDRDTKDDLIKSTTADIAKQLRRVLEQALDWAKKDGAIDEYGSRLPPNVVIIEFQGQLVADDSNSEVQIQKDMSCLAEEWRAYASGADEPSQPPVIFGFVIIKHIITVVTLDAADPNAIIHVPCRLHMAERNQHQWNALAIMVTVCWARDVLTDYADTRLNLQPETPTDSSDPDV